MQRAPDLCEKGITPVDYWEKNKLHFGQDGDQDSQVLKQLQGIYLRNDILVGGRLGEGENSR